jgi:hypothetical protein
MNTEPRGGVHGSSRLVTPIHPMARSLARQASLPAAVALSPEELPRQGNYHLERYGWSHGSCRQ